MRAGDAKWWLVSALLLATSAAHAAEGGAQSSLDTPPPAPTEKPPFITPGGTAQSPDEPREAAPAAMPAPPPSAPSPVPVEPPAAPPGPAAGVPVELPLAPPEVPAEPLASALGLPPLQVHAFASQGAIKSTKNNYLVKQSDRGSVELTEVGINFTQPLTDRLRMGLQLFTSQIGGAGDFRIQADWYYLDYRFADWLGLRAGRTKLPFGLYNEINDIDSARIPVLLPQSVYPLLNRDLLLAQTGLELYGYLRLGFLGGVEYRLYGGTLYSPPPANPAGFTLTDYRIPYIAGGRLMWETPIEGLRVGGSYQAIRIDLDYTSTTTDATMPAGTLDGSLIFRLWMASAEYARDDLLLAAEFGHWVGKLDYDLQLPMMPAMPVAQKTTNARYYVMAGYRVVPWLSPGVYYAGLLPNVDMTDGRQNYQHDFAATLRFDINAFWLVKVEGHYILGTADLSKDLNGGTDISLLADRWFVFLAKTTVYF